MDAWNLNTELLRNLVIALAIGALVGVERERKGLKGPKQFGGLRTFVLLAQAGAVAGWLTADLGSPIILASVTIAVMALMATAYYAANHTDTTVRGLTTEVAGLSVFLLGALTMLGQPEVAVMLAVVTSSLLALKKELHQLVSGLSPEDVFAGLKLLAASFIVLPLLPNEPVDPWGALNPYKLWLLVILISSLALVGYVAVRWLGERRGQALTGLFGGLVSSTAVTLSFARRSVLRPGGANGMALGVLLAWGTMFIRVIVEVAVVNPALLPDIVPPMTALAALSLAAVGVLWRMESEPEAHDDEDVELTNPFSLTEAAKFGLFFAIILLAVKFTQQYTSDTWLYGVAALAGTTDVDAITLSVAKASVEELAHDTAVVSILIACGSNTLVKCGMVVALGSRELAQRVGLATLLLTAVGAASAGWLLVR